SGVLSRSGASALDDGEHDTCREHEVLVSAELDLGAAVLAVQNDVAGRHVERNAVAVVVDATRPDRHDLALLGLLLGGVRNDETAGRGLLSLDLLDDDAVFERLDGNRHGVPLLSCPDRRRKVRTLTPRVLILSLRRRLALAQRECQFWSLFYPGEMNHAELDALLTREAMGLLDALDPVEAASDVARAVSTLRAAGHSPDLVSAVVGQARLRQRARAKFGDVADRMLFTRAGLEQSTRMSVSAHHAGRFARVGVRRVADLGCGIGG